MVTGIWQESASFPEGVTPKVKRWFISYGSLIVLLEHVIARDTWRVTCTEVGMEGYYLKHAIPKEMPGDERLIAAKKEALETVKAKIGSLSESIDALMFSAAVN